MKKLARKLNYSKRVNSLSNFILTISAIVMTVALYSCAPSPSKEDIQYRAKRHNYALEVCRQNHEILEDSNYVDYPDQLRHSFFTCSRILAPGVIEKDYLTFQDLFSPGAPADTPYVRSCGKSC